MLGNTVFIVLPSVCMKDLAGDFLQYCVVHWTFHPFHRIILCLLCVSLRDQVGEHMDPRAQFTNLRAQTINPRAHLINCAHTFLNPKPTHLHTAFFPVSLRGAQYRRILFVFMVLNVLHVWMMLSRKLHYWRPSNRHRPTF